MRHSTLVRRSPRTLNSKVFAAAAPAERSPAAQAVGARESYMFGFKDVGLQHLYLPEATHGAKSALHNSPERGGGARGARVSAYTGTVQDCTTSDGNERGRRFPKPRL